MRHLLSVTDLDAGDRDGAARHRGPAQAGAAGPRGAQAAHAARAHGRHDVLRELHAHPRLLRDRRQVDERRHDQRVGERVVGGQGRVAARHRGDAGGDRRRLHRRAPPGLGRGAPDGALGGPRRGGRCGRADRPGSATSVVNAGDGTHEHPTQALLDAATLRDRLGAVAGRRIGIVGDVLHSRVARSNVFLLATLGAEVVLVAPPTLLPVGVAAWPCRVGAALEAELPRPGRGDDAAGAGRADARRVLPVVAGVRGALRAVRAARRRCCPSTPWCCTRGRWCGAWRSRRPWRTRRRRRCSRRSRTGCTCGWPSSTTCSRELAA